MQKKIINIVILMIAFVGAHAQQRATSSFSIARLKYSGGGDWYNDPSSEPNLLNFIHQNTTIDVNPTYQFVDLTGDNIFSCPFIFLTGHGNVSFSDAEAKKLRAYVQAGGFFYIDDDYGLDKYIRRELKKIFPEKELTELPFSYGLYHCHFDFTSGPPKIHEHDNTPPHGYGIFINGRLAVYYTYESNPSDGWADPDVHHDPSDVRESALKFGTNLVIWALTQ